MAHAQAAVVNFLGRVEAGGGQGRHCAGCWTPMPATRLAGGSLCRACRRRLSIYRSDLRLGLRPALSIMLTASVMILGSIAVLALLATFPHWLIVTLDLGPAWFLSYFGVFYVGGRFARLLRRHGLGG